MKYVGIQTQIWKNNSRSLLLLLAFPLLLISLDWLFFVFYYGNNSDLSDAEINNQFLQTLPFVVAGVGVWFVIAWFMHSKMILQATGSRPLERKENPRVYNLVENLCMSRGLRTPKIHIIYDDSLNAFASGINEKTYAISLSRGIIAKLDDAELEAVIAHELTHIMNRDVRLLIVSIIFVGIFAYISEFAFRALRHSRGDKKGRQGLIILVVLGIIGYLLSILFRYALSQKREFMADAGAAELTKNPQALASALRKISADPWIEAVQREDVAQMFIEHPTKAEPKTFSLGKLFATHPPIEKRIQILEQF